jgi:hypothetical protein
MDQWATAFHEKSERRRRRSRRAALQRIAVIAAVLTALIGASLWGVLTLIEILESL